MNGLAEAVFGFETRDGAWAFMRAAKFSTFTAGFPFKTGDVFRVRIALRSESDRRGAIRLAEQFGAIEGGSR